MIDPSDFTMVLRETRGIEKYVGVPDSYLKGLINYCQTFLGYVNAFNEGEAVSYAFGRNLCGCPTAILMQNSGLMNALSPLTSLTEIYKVPMTMVVGWRGYGNDEPQHQITGEITDKWLMDIGIHVIGVSPDADRGEIQRCLSQVPAEDSVALLVMKGSIGSFDLPDFRKPDAEGSLDRREVVRKIVDSVDDDTVIVATTGYASRDLYELGDRPQNFYNIGSMGCAVSVASGIAEARPDLKVILLDGDGSFLMRPQGEILRKSLGSKNLMRITLVNNEYESTGGQEVSSTIKGGLSLFIKDLIEHSSMLKSQRSSANATIIDNLELLGDYVECSGGQFIIKDLIVPVKPDMTKRIRPSETPEELGQRLIEFLTV